MNQTPLGGRGRRTMAGPGVQELTRLLASNGADPALIAQLHTNRPGVVNTFDPAVFQAAANTATAGLDREAAERRAAMEAQLQREQFTQQAALQNARLGLDRQRARADYSLQDRSQNFRERSARQDQDYRDRALSSTEARQREDFNLRRDGQQFSQGMSLEELEMRRRAEATGDQRFREEMGFRREGQQFSQGATLAEMEMRQQAADTGDRRFREEMGFRREGQQFSQGLSLEELEMRRRAADTSDRRYEDEFALRQDEFGIRQDEFGLRKRAADMSELESLDNMRLREQTFGLDERRMDLAEGQDKKRFSDAEQAGVNWKLEATREMDTNINDMLKAARQMSLSPEGKRVLAQLADERRSIAAAKPDMKPEQYSDMAGQFMNRFAEADLAGYEEQPPSADAIIARSYRKIDGNVGIWISPDGTMRPVESKMALEEAKGAANQDLPAATVEEQWNKMYGGGDKNYDKFLKDYSGAEERLQKKWKADPRNIDDPVAPAMKEEDVKAEMRRMLELQHQFSQPGQAVAPPPAAANPQENVSATRHSVQESTPTPAAAPPVAGDMPVTKTTAELDEEYFQKDPAIGQVRQLFDQAMGMGEKAPPQLKRLAEAMKGVEDDHHPARYISRDAIEELQRRGVADPIGEAAKSVADTINDGEMHFAMMEPAEQNALRDLERLDENDPEDAKKIKQLPPGTFYLDPAMRTKRVPPNDPPKASMLRTNKTFLESSVAPGANLGLRLGSSLGFGR